MTDIVLETIRAMVLLGIVVFLWHSGRSRFDNLRGGWSLIITGFGLLLFGSILDITDNFESLNSFIIIGDTETEAFLEKFVGFLGGFVFLAIGLFKWIPGVQGMSELVDSRTRDLQELNQKLVSEIADRERAERVRHDFISIVSHELRTPLTSIRGSLGLIRSGVTGQLPDKLESMLNIAYNNTDRLLLLINDLLDLQKIESGKLDYDMKPTNIVSLVEEALEINKGYGDKNGVTFVKAAMAKEAMTFGDKNRLMQVLSNLMSNAAKFSPDGEQVELSVSLNGETICVAVKDKGPGISEDHRESIFNKFSQIDPSDARAKDGTGLGLSIAKAIVEHHGGAIGFDSVVGMGSTFFFTLSLSK
ncbi:MAG: HAMP domain-containing histidine kinase [Magnetovibrio sp.]|nr:HAMP domain-containing histidine kinase [Magnetovibrio sp.]